MAVYYEQFARGMITLCGESAQVLGAFAKSQKATISVVMSVRLCVCLFA